MVLVFKDFTLLWKKKAGTTQILSKLVNSSSIYAKMTVITENKILSCVCKLEVWPLQRET